MLVARKFFYFQLFAYFKSRQSAALLFVIILAFFIQLCKAVKFHGISVCLEQTLSAGNIYRLCIKELIFHLARHKTLPYQLIQLVLVARKRRLYLFGSKRDYCRTDSLVCVLSIVLRLEYSGL